MRNIETILSDLGVELTDEQKEAVRKQTAENYVTRAEHDKKLSKAELERDNFKTQAETAAETLKGFEGIDPDKIAGQIADYEKKLKDAEEGYTKKLYERDFSDALKAELSKIKFTSEAAKTAVTAEIMKAGLTMTEGKIIGLSDMLDIIKEKDSAAFVDEAQEKAKAGAARFTAPTGKEANLAAGHDAFKAMSLDERLKLKQTNPDAYKAMKG